MKHLVFFISICVLGFSSARLGQALVVPSDGPSFVLTDSADPNLADSGDVSEAAAKGKKKKKKKNKKKKKGNSDIDVTLEGYLILGENTCVDRDDPADVFDMKIEFRVVDNIKTITINDAFEIPAVGDASAFNGQGAYNDSTLAVEAAKYVQLGSTSKRYEVEYQVDYQTGGPGNGPCYFFFAANDMVKTN